MVLIPKMSNALTLATILLAQQMSSGVGFDRLVLYAGGENVVATTLIVQHVHNQLVQVSSI